MVRVDNIRHTHFSRNPKIAEYLKAFNYVKEYGEGVDRICRDLVHLGADAPEMSNKNSIFSMSITLEINSGQDEGQDNNLKGQDNIDLIISTLVDAPQISIASLAKLCNLTPKTTRNILNKLRAEGKVTHTGPDHGGSWIVKKRR